MDNPIDQVSNTINLFKQGYVDKESTLRRLSELRSSMSPEPKENTDIDNILMGGSIGIIAEELARRLNIDGISALMLFYESETCRRLHDKRTGLYLLSELYIVDDVMAELAQKRTVIS